MRKGGSYLDDKVGDCVVLDATSAILYKETLRRTIFKEVADGGKGNGTCMYVLRQGRNLVKVVSGAFSELKKLNIS